MNKETNTSKPENIKRNLFGTPIGELGVSHAVELSGSLPPKREIMYDAEPVSARQLEELNKIDQTYSDELRSEAQALMATPIPVEFVDQAGRVSIPVSRH